MLEMIGQVVKKRVTVGGLEQEVKLRNSEFREGLTLLLKGFELITSVPPSILLTD